MPLGGVLLLALRRRRVPARNKGLLVLQVGLPWLRPQLQRA
jgi:hypothetical protein